MPPYDSTLFDPPAPLAKVGLRNPDSGIILSNINMLLDTGADVTLIPQVPVNQLGVSIIPGQSYELRGFDGNPSSVQAVQLDLVFLNRTFRGRFLLIEQEWGILGRDVLNLVFLWLDGPGLVWSEHTPLKE